MKTRHKITLLFTLIVTGILLVVSFSVYYFSSLERESVFKKRLISRANNNAQIYSYFKDSSNSVLTRINASVNEMLPRKLVGIYTLTGELIYSYKTNAADTVTLTKKIIEQAIQNDEHYFLQDKLELVAIHYREEGKGIIVVVGGYDEDGWSQLRQLRQIFLVSLLIGTLISLLAGHFFSKQLLRPVAQIIREVNDISSHNLSHRIQAGTSQDELNQLASTFNDLLDRLQESFTSQRRFISNASHELSTPLTSISSQLQVTLQRERNTDEYRQVMQSVQEDVMQLRQLTKSLLEMAKTGSQGSIELNEVRMDEILFKVMADINKLNQKYEVVLNFSTSMDDESNFLVFGNSDLLYIAVKNIVENGCKYSPDHTSRVNLYFGDGSTNIEVKSDGTPVSTDEIDHIFQPFYRSSNSAGISGFGLGLALAKRIIGIHKGTVHVIPENAGMNFLISIPNLSKKA